MAALTCSCLLFISLALVNAGDSYKAAVVEFDPYYNESEVPREVMQKNALKYDEYAAQAAKEGAIIIAFPEYGITTLENYGFNGTVTRDSFLPLLIDVPDPEIVTWNPCLQPDLYTDQAPEDIRTATYDGSNYTDEESLNKIKSHVLHILSCSARKHSIAILANFMSREVCSNRTDPNCPQDGRYQHNTNIVLDRNGTLISRYHKNHLFYEKFLDAAVQPEYAIFEIDSVKFASFICFDMMYSDPAVDLVTKKGIKNIIFSTAWVSEMPFLLGPQVFSRWARGLGVNMIATNYHKPQYCRIASGIYSSQLNSFNETFDVSSKGRLLTADIPIEPEPLPTNNSDRCIVINNGSSYTSLPSDTYKTFIFTDQPTSHPVDPIHKVYYQSLANFSITYLNESENNANICNGEACCQLTYKLNRNNDSAVYALLAYDGVHQLVRSIYYLGMQTCAVMRCEVEGDIESCGRVRNNTNNVAVFEELSLVALMNADTILPSATNADMQLKPAEEWSFSKANCPNGKIQSSISFLKTTKPQKSPGVVSVYGRLYDRDFTAE